MDNLSPHDQALHDYVSDGDSPADLRESEKLYIRLKERSAKEGIDLMKEIDGVWCATAYVFDEVRKARTERYRPRSASTKELTDIVCETPQDKALLAAIQRLCRQKDLEDRVARIYEELKRDETNRGIVLTEPTEDGRWKPTGYVAQRVESRRRDYLRSKDNANNLLPLHDEIEHPSLDLIGQTLFSTMENPFDALTAEEYTTLETYYLNPEDLPPQLEEMPDDVIAAIHKLIVWRKEHSPRSSDIK